MPSSAIIEPTMKYLLILALTLIALGCQKEIKEIRRNQPAPDHLALAR